MNKIACQYAIVRFAPFVETGEFANAGVLLLATQAGYFDFKLQTRRHRRITSFFGELDAKTYRTAMQTFAEELRRARDMLRAQGFEWTAPSDACPFAQRLFAEIVRPRETIVRFSEPRLVLADDPATKLVELFNHYVERDFVTKEYQEAVLERGLRMLFNRTHLGTRFERGQVGDEGFHVAFPFVEHRDKRTVKAIKALNLAQDQASKIRDHALVWRGRIEKLRSRHTLPDKVLFAVSAPERRGNLDEAFDEATCDLRESGAEVSQISDSERILEFAVSQ
jgi:hypothetical protein